MRGYSAVGMMQPKTSHNVGSALRACYCYGVSMLAIQGKRYERSPSDTLKGWRHLPFLQTEDLKSVIPYDCVPVAVDLVEGAYNLAEYIHPERAFYIFGPEDGTLGEKTLSWCRDKIYVPTRNCMNLAAAINVVLYARMANRKEWMR